MVNHPINIHRRETIKYIPQLSIPLITRKIFDEDKERSSKEDSQIHALFSKINIRLFQNSLKDRHAVVNNGVTNGMHHLECVVMVIHVSVAMHL